MTDPDIQANVDDILRGMKTPVKLLPCPLCGGKAHEGICYVDTDKALSEPAVRCVDCSCRATLKAWNTRPDTVSYQTWMATVRECNEAKEDARRLREAAPSRPVTVEPITNPAPKIRAFRPAPSAAAGREITDAMAESGARALVENLIAHDPRTTPWHEAQEEARTEILTTVRTVLAAALAISPQVLCVWQPIETAPKDGTWIIAACNDRSSLYRISWGRARNGDLCWCTADNIVSYGDGLFSPNGGWIPCPLPRAEPGAKK